MNRPSGSGSGSVAASGAAGTTLLIYTVLNTLSSSGSGIQSGAASSKRSNGSRTHFSSINASCCTGFHLIQLYYCDVFPFL